MGLRILVKFPSRNRAKKFGYALDKYIEYASDLGNVHFLFTLDSNDEDLGEYLKIIGSKEINKSIVIGVSRSKIEAVNRDLNEFLEVNEVDVILLASDDMIPCQKYQIEIANRAEKLGLDYVYWFSDGNQKRLNTLSIIGHYF